MEKIKKPVVYDYKDLTEYLKDVYKFRKRHESSFSYDKWSDEMELKSRAYLRSLVLGEKSIPGHLLPVLARGLQLNSEEMSYFVSLFNYHTAPTGEIKAIYGREIFKVWSRHVQEIEISEISDFLSDSMTPYLFTYLSFDDSPSDINQWAKDLNCDVDRVRNALKCLIWHKLVDGKVSEDGQCIYRTVLPNFRIPSIDSSSYLKSFHLNGLRDTEVAMVNESSKAYATFVALSPEQYVKAQELIVEFNRQLLATFNDQKVQGKKIYRLNQYLLSISEVISPDQMSEAN